MGRGTQVESFALFQTKLGAQNTMYHKVCNRKPQARDLPRPCFGSAKYLQIKSLLQVTITTQG